MHLHLIHGTTSALNGRWVGVRLVFQLGTGSGSGFYRLHAQPGDAEKAAHEGDHQARPMCVQELGCACEYADPVGQLDEGVRCQDDQQHPLEGGLIDSIELMSVPFFVGLSPADQAAQDGERQHECNQFEIREELQGDACGPDDDGQDQDGMVRDDFF
ncbi:MAG: hypothetical protein PVF83_13390 [Anaerolineales bacterium]